MFTAQRLGPQTHIALSHSGQTWRHVTYASPDPGMPGPWSYGTGTQAQIKAQMFKSLPVPLKDDGKEAVTGKVTEKAMLPRLLLAGSLGRPQN